MSSLLRQLLAVLVVTIVSTGLVVSATKAAMALDCEMTSIQAVSDVHGKQAASENQDYSGHLVGVSDPASGHMAHSDLAQDRNDTAADAVHCKTHACPSTAIVAFDTVMPSVEIGRNLRVMRAGSLVEPTVPEGLRRPPRG